MPVISGSFLGGQARLQTAISLSDQLNHELNLAEIGVSVKLRRWLTFN